MQACPCAISLPRDFQNRRMGPFVPSVPSFSLPCSQPDPKNRTLGTMVPSYKSKTDARCKLARALYHHRGFFKTVGWDHLSHPSRLFLCHAHSQIQKDRTLGTMVPSYKSKAALLRGLCKSNVEFDSNMAGRQSGDRGRFTFLRIQKGLPAGWIGR
jgi:hypothetical protein